MKLLVSACLMGMRCRYDGGTNTLPRLAELMDQYTCIPVCPEMFGGLPTPRVPAERRREQIINQKGENVTEAFVQGAAEVLRLAELYDCKMALLKEHSPSCGSGQIYDGTFSGILVPGDGVAAQAMKKHGITVFGESQIEELLPEDDVLLDRMVDYRAKEQAEKQAKQAEETAAREAAIAQAMAEDSAADFGTTAPPEASPAPEQPEPTGAPDMLETEPPTDLT